MTFVQGLLKERPAQCIWDVGANVGFWTLFFAGLRPTPRIVAFEPDTTNLRLLHLNAERNALQGVTIRECALADSIGEATFYADDISGVTGSLESGHVFITKHLGQPTRPVTTTVSTVDAEVDRLGCAPDFLKIDVEGHEVQLLKGARHTLETHRPRLIVDVSRSNAREVGELLRAYEYQLLCPKTGEELSVPLWNTVAIPRGI